MPKEKGVKVKWKSFCDVQLVVAIEKEPCFISYRVILVIWDVVHLRGAIFILSHEEIIVLYDIVKWHKASLYSL